MDKYDKQDISKISDQIKKNKLLPKIHRTRKTRAALPRPSSRPSSGFKNTNDAHDIDIWSMEQARSWKPVLVF